MPTASKKTDQLDAGSAHDCGCDCDCGDLTEGIQAPRTDDAGPEDTMVRCAGGCGCTCGCAA